MLPFLVFYGFSLSTTIITLSGFELTCLGNDIVCVLNIPSYFYPSKEMNHLIKMKISRHNATICFMYYKR